jgi:hypothetical protein
VEQYSGARLSFRELSHLNSMRSILRQQEKIAREISNKERMLRSFDRIEQIVLNANSARNLALGMTHTAGWAELAENRAAYYLDLAKSIVPESMRPGFQLTQLRRNFASVGHHTRIQSDALRYGNMFGGLGLSNYIGQVAQAIEAQSFPSINSADWSFRIVHSFRTPALQSILNSSTTFGPIVVSPDDEALPSNYHPDLQGWLVPETATESGAAIDVEELLSQVFTFAADKAQQYRSNVSISVVGKSGLRYLVRVSETVVGGLILYWLLHR